MVLNKSFEYEKMLNFMKKTDGFFEKQLINNHLTIEQYADKLCKKATVAYEENDEVEGMVIGYTDETPNNSSYITQVYVLPSYRNRGVAVKLLNEYINYCKNKKLNSIWLTTHKNNEKAQNLYNRCGFKKVDYNHQNLIKMEMIFNKEG